MVQGIFFLISPPLLGRKTFNLVAHHDGRVVGVSHHGMLRVLLMRVSNHAKQAVCLILAINGELGIENFVSAVLAVGLCKHHQFNVAGISAKLLERT